MKIENQIRKALAHYEDHRPLFAFIATTVIEQFEQSVINLNTALEPFENIDLNSYLKLSNALQSLSKKPKGIEERLERYGLSYPTKASRKNFILEATQRGYANEIAAELLRKPTDVLDEQLNKLMKSPEQVATLPMTQIKVLLKYVGREPLLSAGKKKYSNDDAIITLKTYLMERKSMVGL